MSQFMVLPNADPSRFFFDTKEEAELFLSGYQQGGLIVEPLRLFSMDHNSNGTSQEVE